MTQVLLPLNLIPNAPGTPINGPVGPQGPPGADGIQGPPGNDGADGADGTNGNDGTNGADGADAVLSPNIIQGYMLTAEVTDLGPSNHLKFDNVYFQVGSDISLDTSSAYTTAFGPPSIGRITLAPNHIYKMTFNPNRVGGAGDITFNWSKADTISGSQLGLQTNVQTTGSCGDVIAFYQTGGSPGFVQLLISGNNGVDNIGVDNLPWFCVEQIG